MLHLFLSWVGGHEAKPHPSAYAFKCNSVLHMSDWCKEEWSEIRMRLYIAGKEGLSEWRG